MRSYFAHQRSAGLLGDQSHLQLKQRMKLKVRILTNWGRVQVDKHCSSKKANFDTIK